MSVCDDIPGTNQSVEVFIAVLVTRAVGFGEWYRDNQGTTDYHDESDWDDKYQKWLEEIDQNINNQG